MKPENSKQVLFRVTENEKVSLKIRALKEKMTVQEMILKALDKVFPGWREEHNK